MSVLTAINVAFCATGLLGTMFSVGRFLSSRDMQVVQSRYNVLVGDVAFLRSRLRTHIPNEREMAAALDRDHEEGSRRRAS